MTTNNPTTNEDGQLQPALTDLTHAIHQLTAPIPDYTDGQLRYTDSLYQQLTNAVPGQFLGRTGTPRSQPPLWIDAVDLLARIDTQTRTWCPEGNDTPQRLQTLTGRPWRPQDVNLLTTYSQQIRAWTKTITNLLTDQHTKHIPAPCPACNTTTIHRPDNAGDIVRQPALQITTHGCECQNCHTTWGPEKFLFLARLLGFDMPAGVLE